MGNIVAGGWPINQKGSPALYSDTLANRPAAGLPGRLFVSTDTFALYRDTGSTWDLIGGPGTGTITGSLADTQVAYGIGANTIGGNANFTYDAATGQLLVQNSSAINAPLVAKNSNANGELLFLRDAADNNVVIVDQFGTIYASALEAYLTFANVYAGGFINDDPIGKGVNIQGGSITTESLLIQNYDATVTMFEVYQDRVIAGVPLKINTTGALIDQNSMLTNNGYYRFRNSGNDLYFGINGSTAGVVYPFLSAYASYLICNDNRDFFLGTNGTWQFFIDGITNNIGINTDDPKTFLQTEGSSGITSFTGASRMGISSSGANANGEYSGIDFDTIGATIPKARIAARFDFLGSYLILGTSNNYATGITNQALTIDYDGNVILEKSIETEAPSGGTAVPWKLGSVIAAASVFDATNYVEVEINGTPYKLALAN